jgi:ParB family chromosome partitioning protein
MAIAGGVAVSADEHRCALRERILDVRLDLLHRLVVDERSLRRAGVQARRRVQLPDGDGELCGECVVDRVLHEHAVRAHAGLAGVSILRDDRALHCGIQIRIVEHDERRIAAELQRELLHRPRALRHEDFANRGRAGER